MHHASGSEVACEHKEQGNAQKAAGEKRRAHVIKDDAGNGDGAQAVER